MANEEPTPVSMSPAEMPKSFKTHSITSAGLVVDTVSDRENLVGMSRKGPSRHRPQASGVSSASESMIMG